MRTFVVSLIVLLNLWTPLTFGAPDQTMTIAPSATAGTTILAADENDRSNDTSTPYNAHTHTDISQTANTLNVGDGAAGNKNICGNAADGTDSCIRWDDTNNLWLVDHPTAGTFNQIMTASGTAGLTGNQVVLGNGLGALITTTGGSSGQFLTHQGGSAPTWTSGTTATVADRAQRTAGDFTTTNNTATDITGMEVPLVTGANPALVCFNGTFQSSSATENVQFYIDVDGTDVTEVEDATGVAAENDLVDICVMTADLTAASHTFQAEGSIGGGATLTVQCDATLPCTLSVVEVTD